MSRHGWIGHTAGVMTAVTSVIALGIWLVWPWWEYAFFSDDSAVSWLSSALLSANAAVALSLGLRRREFLGLAVALAALAVDEQFLLHERWQDTVGMPFTMAPVVALAMGGLSLAFSMRRINLPAAGRGLMTSAIVVGLVAVAVDAGALAGTLAWSEELLEVVAEGLFLSGLLEVGRD